MSERKNETNWAAAFAAMLVIWSLALFALFALSGINVRVNGRVYCLEPADGAPYGAECRNGAKEANYDSDREQLPVGEGMDEFEREVARGKKAE